MSGPLVWLDLETTGLTPGKDAILEIAMVATDGDLKSIPDAPDPLNFVLKGGLNLNLSNWAPEVVKMHASSGLLAETRSSLIERTAAAKRVSEWLRALGENVGMTFASAGITTGPIKSPANDELKFVMAGSTIDFDRRFYESYDFRMDVFHYRTINVSSVKELVRRWYGEDHLFLSPDPKPHRALEDVYTSMAELLWYRDTCFKSPKKTTGGK